MFIVPEIKVFWVSSEAIPRTNNLRKFLGRCTALIETLSKASIHHEFQDLEQNREILAQLIKEENNNAAIITPEPELYLPILSGRTVLPVDISRITDVVEWKTIGHTKNFPKLHGDSIFIDTVSFSGRTIEEAAKHYNIKVAVVELKGKYATKKLEKIGINIRSARDIDEFDAVWHLDDFVREIETQNGVMPASFFIKNIYQRLVECIDNEQFRKMLEDNGIKLQQTSPNLFLELSRPNSYLAKSFEKQNVVQTAELVKKIEQIYNNKGAK